MTNGRVALVLFAFVLLLYAGAVVTILVAN
jgi:hypothetical protein